MIGFVSLDQPRPERDSTRGAAGRKRASQGNTRMKGRPPVPGFQRPEHPNARRERLRRIASGR